MADFESGEPAVPQLSSSNELKHSGFTNDGRVYDPTLSQTQDTSTTEPSSQGNNHNQSEMAKESPKKIKSPIAAAAADREIALRVWMASSDRDDDVRDALGRMLGWVEELVGPFDILRVLSKFNVVISAHPPWNAFLWNEITSM